MPQIVLLHQKPQNAMWRRIRYRVVFFLEVLDQPGDQLKQLVLFLAGRASFAELRNRILRQAQFLALRPGRVGG